MSTFERDSGRFYGHTFLSQNGALLVNAAVEVSAAVERMGTKWWGTMELEHLQPLPDGS